MSLSYCMLILLINNLILTTLTAVNQFGLLKSLFAATLPDILKLYPQNKIRNLSLQLCIIESSHEMQ